MITFTEYTNESTSFRIKLTTHCVNEGRETQETKHILRLLDKLDKKSVLDSIFREKVFKWFQSGKNDSIVELSKSVGYDFEESVRSKMIIDLFIQVN